MRQSSAAARWRGFHIAIMVVVWAGAAQSSAAESFQLDMVYKYSEQFRGIMKGRDMEHLVSDWPQPGTAEFYHRLAVLDRHRHVSRNLLAGDAFSLTPTNETFLFDVLGGLHYSLVGLGTPMQAFLVALDTGSDLLWVPCDCQQCSATNWTTYGLNADSLQFAVYSPSNSTTSKPVPCNDSICTRTLSSGTCGVAATETCTYEAKYLSANTSSSGTIVEDVLYLNSESATGGRVTTSIYFGCGRVQTGDFLNGAAPNGLFGLGPEVYSVPTTLAKNSITSNVFSMCFSPDGSGRLVFGRKPAASLQSTPLIKTNPNVVYILKAAGFLAAGVRVNVTGNVVFDTGTSLTTLPSDVVKALGEALGSKLSIPSFAFNYRQAILFSYCWNITTNSELQTLSKLSMIFAGEGTWAINNPVLKFGDSATGTLAFVCLGIVDSDLLNAVPIIGFNFMEGYEYFFDQETSTFSWGASDCYSSNGTAAQSPGSGINPPLIAPEASPPLTVPVAGSTPESSPKTPARSPPDPSSTGLPQSPSSQSQSSSSSSSLLVLLVSTTFFFLLAK